MSVGVPPASRLSCLHLAPREMTLRRFTAPTAFTTTKNVPMIRIERRNLSRLGCMLPSCLGPRPEAGHTQPAKLIVHKATGAEPEEEVRGGQEYDHPGE